MSRFPITEHRRRQRGEMLIEALVGTLLLSLIGLGASYTTSRVLVSQRYLNAQSIAIVQMRALLQRYGAVTLCADPTSAVIVLPPAQSLTLDVACTDGAAVTVNGSALTAVPPGLRLSATSVARFGGSGTIVVGDGY